jgi:GT2 family glycosyltransferase
MKNIINVVVCYNNAKEVLNYAKELSKLNESDKLSLIVVINAAKAEDIELLNTLSSEVSFHTLVVNPNENLGYMKGLMYGYEKYKESTNSIPDYAIMGNTDIEYEDTDFLVKLSNKEYSEDTWCIGPSVFTKYTHNYDNPVALERRSVQEIDKLLFRFSVLGGFYVWLARVKESLTKKRLEKLPSQYVYEVHGCMFILRGLFCEKLLEKPFKPLMYSEETYLAEMAYQNGKKVYYDADLEIIHLEHTSTSLVGNKKIAKYLLDSMRFIRNEFYS